MKSSTFALFLLAVSPCLAQDAAPATAELVATGSVRELEAAVQRLETYKFMLPDSIPLVSGETRRIYFRNIVPVEDPEVFDYGINCTCDFAELNRRYVEISVPDGEDKDHWLTITAGKPGGERVAAAQVRLETIARSAEPAKTHYTVFFVGDSLGHQSRFPNYVVTGLDSLHGAAIDYIGTHRPGGALVPHEQYGGWTFNSFLKNYGLDPKIFHTDHSPFVFPPPDEGGQPIFDPKRYFAERAGGRLPDFIHIQLGINDAFLLDPLQPAAMKDGIDSIFADADVLIAGLRAAAPNAVISLGTVIPGNGSDRAYVESYPASPSLHKEWRWRQVQQEMVRRMVAHFGRRESENLYLLPTHVFLDSIDGYSSHAFVPTGVSYLLSHAVHPTPSGDEQLAAPIHAFLRAKMTGVEP